MAVKYWLDGNDNWATSADWTGASVPGSGDDAVVYQGGPRVTAPIALRSLTISKPATVSFENSGSSSVSNFLTTSGTLQLDYYNGQGGTSLSVNGRLTNTGTVHIGNGGLSAATSLSTQYLTNTGTIELDGTSTVQAALDVNSAAGFGTLSTLNGTVQLFGDTVVTFNSGAIRTIAANSSLRLSGPDAFIAITGSTGSNSALTGLASIERNASLSLEQGANVAVATAITNYGTMNLDYFNGEGGSALSVGGRLTNLGSMQIGNGGLGSSDSVNTLYLTNKGTIVVDGSTNAKASLVVGSAAGFGTPYALTGIVTLYNNALISFASNQIRTLAANSLLRIDGPNAFVADAGSTTSNSALTGLATIGKGANLLLDNGAAISTANLNNYGSIGLDYYNGFGGAALSLSGQFTNVGNLQIGNGGLSAATSLSTRYLKNTGTIELDGSASAQASLSVNDFAGFGTRSVVTGTVRLLGNTLITFKASQITKLAANSYLRLDGPKAFIADAGQTTSNSALTGLGTISVGATFLIGSGASVAVAKSLSNYGTLELDYFYSSGGSSLGVGATLDNEAYLQIGNGGQTTADMVTATSLTNNGTINLNGNGPGTSAVGATLAVNSMAGTGTTGHLSGSITLTGDSLIQFAGGQIGTIDNGASLRINGSNGFVADLGSTTSNSALTGLSEIDGTLYLENGAKISTSGDLTNDGDVRLDYFYSEGGANLTVAGALDNEGYLQVGNGGQSLAEVLTVASLTNGGTINLYGNNNVSPNVAASLIVKAAAGTGTTGELTGTFYLQGDTLLQFDGGQINAIDAGANLRINGGDAFVADSGSTTSNSALTGLTENDGTFYLENSATVATSGALVNAGNITLDNFNGEGGANLTVGGNLDNESYLQIGNGGMSLGDIITAASLTNNGTIQLNGNASATPSISSTLSVSGAVVNNGTVTLSNDVQTFASAVSGTGSMTLQNNASLEFGSSVAASQSVGFQGTDKLLLDAAKSFAAAINGFSAGDTIDVKGFGAGTTLAFTENQAGTAGTLAVMNGSNSARLAFNGVYSTSSFVASSDGSGGTLIAHA